MEILSHIANVIITIIEKTGYYGVFVLMTLESALIPIPSEVTMPFAGYLVSLNKMNIHILSFVGGVANLFGSILAYWLGFWAEERLIRQWIKKYGRFLLIDENDYERSEKWFRKYGDPVVFFSRILPAVRTFISLPAGVAKMNFGRFCIFTFIGSIIWSYFLAYVGFFLGRNWSSISVYYRKFEYLIVFILVALILFYVVRKIKKIKRS
ncbi:MAG: Inner membrane protein YqjA [candidate division TA06 bacterium ADurb.Bin131]|uniref:Inner membrane protein YqjA n=1 Tax=candidate division TA06 bacterium ADurb.Bin131 TaxID=1852827 RepID=A0A1V6CBI3_UNCT6|nr:MAG: Inner membrane protein YqjA [candidate division TA06 bacterium ADurb.Bin131]